MTDFNVTVSPATAEPSTGAGGPHVPVSFLRVIRHLLPDAEAWKLPAGEPLHQYIEGLAEGYKAAREFVDDVLGDFWAPTTRELAEWEYQFGLIAPASEGDRRSQLAGAKRAAGGQSPRYLQDVVQAAGFDVYVHEWWVPGSAPRTVRDPRLYTEIPAVGTVQCLSSSPFQCREALGGPANTGLQAQCNAFLANEPRYIVNKNRSGLAPPPISDDAATWRHFLYYGGAVFGTDASVPAARREEFERLILKISPAHLWLVTLVTYA